MSPQMMLKILDLEKIQKDQLEVADQVQMNAPSATTPNGENNSVDPQNGMEFNSANDVYKFYNIYARRVGFGITTVCSRTNYRKEVCFKHLACWRQGKSRKTDKSMNHRDTGKIDCKASIKARLDSKSGKWILGDVITQHNHNMSITSTGYLRSHRRISTPEKAEISNLHAVNVPTTQIYSAMARRKGGRRQLEFTEKDARNYISRERQSQLKEGDAQSMIIHFTQMQVKNANFFYTLDLNDNGQLRSVFWIHPRSRMACTYFGDVLTFDSTYLTNTYQMPFCPFVGVNHHGQSTLLGCALLSDERTETYKWVLQAWLDGNGGQAPNAIITDQDRAIEAAVKSVFPNARHRFCLWHILKKVPEKIGHICTANPKFMFEFDEAIYDSVTIQSFEERWAHLMQKYEECNDIDWLNDLYDCREKWVPVYLKDTFFAGMSSSQRSESINHFFDGFINSKTTLKEFIDKYEDALEKRYEAENEEDNKSLQTNAFLKTSSPFERQASGKYTRRIFKKFQSEIIEMAASNAKLVKEEDNCVTYSVKSFERIEADGINKEIIKIYTVAYDKSLDDVECQCRSFQFKGYLCRHALLVLHQNDLIRIPAKYFLKRWCKDMKYQFDEIECNTQYCDKSTRKSRYTISNPIMSYSMFCLKYIRLQEILLQIRYIVDCRYAVLSHRMMKLAEISSMSEDAFKLVMDDLTALFRRAVDANSVAKECTEPVIQDPSQITTKGRPRENRLKSGVEKKSKRSRKATDKATVDSPLQNPRSADTSKQDNSQHVVEFPQQITKRTVPYSDPFLDEFDAYVSSQVTQESV